MADEKFDKLIKKEGTEKMKSAKELIENGILEIAKEPKNNPESLEFPHYMLTLIEDDYPGKTPTIWNAVYKELGWANKIASIMLVGDPKNAEIIVEALRKDESYIGGGAGVGFKDELVPYLKLDSIAKEIGAVNIIKKEGNYLIGYNTDGEGYAKSLEQKLDEGLNGKKVVMLGAGGTGNAIAFALVNRGVKLIVLNRTIDKAKKLSEKLNNYFNKKDDKKVLFGGEDEIANYVTRDVDVIVNVSIKGATGNLEKYCSLSKAKLPATEENIRENINTSENLLRKIDKHVVISDIILRKGNTPLLKMAKKEGFDTLDGIPMVINQAIKAFEILHRDDIKEQNVDMKKVAEIIKNIII